MNCFNRALYLMVQGMGEHSSTSGLGNEHSLGSSTTLETMEGAALVPTLLSSMVLGTPRESSGRLQEPEAWQINAAWDPHSPNYLLHVKNAGLLDKQSGESGT